jgi:hypothetical protein
MSKGFYSFSRLSWAFLSLGAVPFTLVNSFVAVHHPQSLLARIGCSDSANFVCVNPHRNHFGASALPFTLPTTISSTVLRYNAYDDWRSDAVVPTVTLTEENIQECLETLVMSDYGQTMFGCHERPASVGITGRVELVELQGPEVVLRLEGSFWHRRETVLGRAAVWLNACMPELVQVRVDDLEELEDFEDVRDEFTGELLAVRDKRAPDFNGDRQTMEYQGIDPDVRGPFPPGVGGAFTINPA